MISLEFLHNYHGLKVVEYGKENQNRTTGRKFSVSEIFLRDWKTRILSHECLGYDSEA
jgi:hypothetical protein